MSFLYKRNIGKVKLKEVGSSMWKSVLGEEGYACILEGRKRRECYLDWEEPGWSNANAKT